MNWYKEKVRKWYQEALALNKNVNSDLKRALKAHERVPNFIDNLSIEFSKVQVQRAREHKSPLSEKTLQQSTYDMVDVFITGLKNKYDIAAESEAKKMAREREIQYQKDLEATASGTPSGEFQELEIIDATDRQDLTFSNVKKM